MAPVFLCCPEAGLGFLELLPGLEVDSRGAGLGLEKDLGCGGHH